MSQGGVHWSMHLGNKGRERTKILAVVSEPQSCSFSLIFFYIQSGVAERPLAAGKQIDF